MKYLEKYIDKVLMVCLKVMVDKRCGADDELKGLVGMFLTRLGVVETIRVMLADLISKMSEGEKQELRKYVC